eukprot:13041494-Ditylum_brightwellii.AAC.1
MIVNETISNLTEEASPINLQQHDNMTITVLLLRKPRETGTTRKGAHRRGAMAEGKKWIIAKQGASGKFDDDMLGIL